MLELEGDDVRRAVVTAEPLRGHSYGLYGNGERFALKEEVRFEKLLHYEQKREIRFQMTNNSLISLSEE